MLKTELKTEPKNGRNRTLPTKGMKDLVSDSPMLNLLSAETREMLVSKGRSFALKKGGLLFIAGDDVDAVYYLISGKLKEYYTTENGDVCLRRILTPGSYISLHLMLTGQSAYSYTCEAVTASTIFRWNTQELMSHVRRDASVATAVASVLADDIEHSCRLQCLCRKTQAIQRVAGYLLRQCNFCNCRYSAQGRCPASRQALQANIRPLEHTAKDICLARETFSRSLSSLQQQKIIRLENGNVEIIDLEALKKISGISD